VPIYSHFCFLVNIFSNWSKSFHQSEQTKPIKSTESSEYCEEEVEGKASNSSWESVSISLCICLYELLEYIVVLCGMVRDVEMVGASYIEKKVVIDQYSMLFPGILQSKRVATLKEQNAPSKTIYVKNLSYRVERADMYVLLFMQLLVDYFHYIFL